MKVSKIKSRKATQQETVTKDEYQSLQKELDLLNHKYHEEVKKTNRYRLALLRILDQS